MKRGTREGNTLCREHSPNNISAATVAGWGRIQPRRMEQVARENERQKERERERGRRRRKRERETEEMAVPYQKLPHRETSTKKLSSVPPRGEAIMRWETQCDRSDDFQRVTSVYSFSRFFFTLFQRRSLASERTTKGKGMMCSSRSSGNFRHSWRRRRRSSFRSAKNARGGFHPSNTLTHVRRSGYFRSGGASGA